MEAEIKEFGLEVTVYGVFGRKRKPGHSYSQVDWKPEGTVFTELEATQLAQAYLTEIKAKPGAAWRVIIMESSLPSYGGRMIHYRVGDGEKVIVVGKI